MNNLTAIKTMSVFALAGWVIAALITGLVGYLLIGLVAVNSVIISAVLVVAFFLSGQAIDSYALKFTNSFGLALTLFSFAIRMAIFGIVLWLLSSSQRFLEIIDAKWFALAALICVIGWTTGLVIGHSRSRFAIFVAQANEPLDKTLGEDEKPE